MSVRRASAVWSGTLKDGHGTMKAGAKGVESSYSAGSRFEEEKGSNPEELIGAAHAGCFSMALAAELEKAGYEPERVETTASVHIQPTDGGFEISKIELSTEAQVPGIDNETFQKHAEDAKNGCPVSKALAGPEIVLFARLK